MIAPTGPPTRAPTTEAPTTTEPPTEAVEMELQVVVRVRRDESSNWTICHLGENITHYVNVSGTKGETLCNHGENITHYVNVNGTKGEKNRGIH